MRDKDQSAAAAASPRTGARSLETTGGAAGARLVTAELALPISMLLPASSRKEQLEYKRQE